jgi:hypothetical protein
MKVGDTGVSKLGTNLRYTVKAVTKKEVTVVVERRRIDKGTGEIIVHEVERVVPTSRWRFFASPYE